MRRLGYQPTLDGLRALAVGSVVLRHYTGFPGGGALGVDLFFVLSGFLITVLLLEERRVHGSISLSRFYLRRVLRLVPALWALLLVWLVVSLLQGKPSRDVFATVAFAATYTLNIAIAFGSSAVAGLGHLWSLGVEEQFYLAWPALLIVFLHRRVPLRRVVAIAGAAAIAIAVVRFALRPEHVSSRFDAGSVTRFDSILVGCALGLAFASPLQDRLLDMTRRVPLLAAALAVCVALEIFGGGNDLFYLGGSLAFALAVAVVLAASVRRDPLDAAVPLRVLSSSLFVFFGRISYALYLWHSPVLQWTKEEGLAAHVGQAPARVLALAVSIGAASASHYLVERPFLRLKWRLARTSSHDVSIGAAVRHGSEAGQLGGVLPAGSPSTPS